MMATKKKKANIKKLQADVNKQLADLKPQTAAVQKQVDPLGYAVTQAQKDYDKAKAGTSGTAINTALKNLSSANTALAQDRAIKPELDALSVARGDTTQWNPKTQQYQIIKGPNEVTQNFNMNTKQWEFSTGGGGGGAGGTGGFGGTDTTNATNALLAKQEADKEAEEKRRKGQSAYDILISEFTRYGLQSLVEPLKGLITSGASSAEFSLALQNTDAYKKRFAANQKRIDAGLGALSPAEYVALEDQYQNVMRNYGLPATYYTKDPMGTQQGFEKFLAADVSATELEDRIMTAQNRVLKSNPQVAEALKSFYPDITNGDILAYALNPQQGLSDIKRKVTAAEIGGAAMQSGLSTNLARAEELGRYGVDKESATQGFATIGAGLERGSQLASIYKEDPYTQTTAETEVFNIPGAKEARKQRQKITGLEKATFGGQSGISQGALARDRAGAY
jgi:hypothetical protein